MGDTPIVYIENGRHPLQELIIEGEFIKNSTVIDQNSRVHIVTGSNFSGKSCK
jgi:DNA mismatch repair protein MSH5